MNADLLALAERVEASTGPDRRLDYLVMCTTVPIGGGYIWDPDDQHHRYTKSLDAAMTLIGDKQYWRLGNDGEGSDVAMFKATVTSGDGPTLAFHDAVALTPALALTAAALRARASQEASDAA